MRLRGSRAFGDTLDRQNEEGEIFTAGAALRFVNVPILVAKADKYKVYRRENTGARPQNVAFSVRERWTVVVGLVRHTGAEK